MNCQEIQRLAGASVDGELDAVHSVEIEAHLRQCPSCSTTFQDVQRLKSAISSSNLYYKAPAGLENRIRAQIAPQAREEPRLTPSAPFRGLWLKWAVSVAGAAIIACVATVMWMGSRPGGGLADEVAASHVRSLMAAHLSDVASTDQHTVKPWFDGKLDFAPPTVDLAPDGFALIGGRLDYLDNRAVAALVFQHQKHIINLFIWPGNGDGITEERTFVRNGYNLVHWTQPGMTCWAVSDLNQSELGNFAALFRNHTAPAAR